VDASGRLKKFPRLSPTSWLTTKTIFSQLFAVLLFAIQAPLLGPRAFGLISIVMIFVGFCESVPGEAAAESLISIRTIENEHYSTMTTVNVVVSLIFGMVVFFGAGQFARLFGDTELAKMLRWMAILPMITALAAAPTAATKRDMLFGPLALRSIGSLFVGGMVGLLLTLTGAGVWALVWQAMVTRLVAIVVLWYAVPLKFGLGFSRRHFRDLARYAAPTMLSRTMSWVTSQLPRFLLGLFWGATDLGLFSLAGRLSDILMEVAVVPRYAVARVELRQYSSDRAGLNAAIRETLQKMSLVCFPLCIGGAAVVPTLFHVWLDPRWYGGIEASQLMLLMCVPSITNYFASALLLAFNEQAADAVISIVQTVVTVVVVVAAAPFGITMAAAAVAGRPFLLLPLSAIVVKRKCAVAVRPMLEPQLPVFVAAVLMGFTVWAIRTVLDGILLSIPLLIVELCTGANVYVVLIALLQPHVAARFIREVRVRFG
jgi:O-antigen/teichoic acid export membrane protein